MLAEYGVPNARRNAEWLLCDSLGYSPLDLYIRSGRRLSDQEAEVYWGGIRRRCGREPLQYIVGTTEFMSLPFVTPTGVFVPRPDTEVLVELAETRLRGLPLDSPLEILDLCCGSGVIAVSLAARIPNLTAVAVDTCARAVTTTRTNAERNGVGERVLAVETDAREYLESGLDRTFSAVVCNPPYVRVGELASLPPEVRDHEPRAALDGGQEGLDFYRVVAPGLARRVRPGGFAAFEIGDGLGAAVRNILIEAGFADVAITPDYAGRHRVVHGVQPA